MFEEQSVISLVVLIAKVHASIWKKGR